MHWRLDNNNYYYQARRDERA